MHRVLRWTGAIALLAAVTAAWAAGPQAKGEPAKQEPAKSSAAQQYQALVKEFNDAGKEFNRLNGAAKTPEERQKVVKEKLPRARNYVARFLKIAEDHPKDPVAVDALGWIAVNGDPGPELTRAVAILQRDHLQNDKLVPLCVAAAMDHIPNGEECLRTVIEKNPHHEVQGVACFLLAVHLKNRAERDKPNAEAILKEAEACFERIAKDYADVKLANRLLGPKSEGELTEMGHLAVGQVSPDIEGEDIDGQQLKLSDSRGRVTLLVFWASWCVPCMAAVPHERELVERYKDRPFALVGVNGDGERDKAKKVVERERMTWRSFWNGKGGPEGAISTKWNLQGWPTVYVLDAKGVIRYKSTGANERLIDATIEKLLKEMGTDEKK